LQLYQFNELRAKNNPKLYKKVNIEKAFYSIKPLGYFFIYICFKVL